MTTAAACPGCGAALPPLDGPTHAYIGASPACWALFAALVNAGEPPVAPAPLNALCTDAYAVQHPGSPSPQAIQSVAVHLVALHGVLKRGIAAEQALWLRQRALRGRHAALHRQFVWLVPPALAGLPTVADIVAAPDPPRRAELMQHYVTAVYARWDATHASTIAEWYARYVERD